MHLEDSHKNLFQYQKNQSTEWENINNCEYKRFAIFNISLLFKMDTINSWIYKAWIPNSQVISVNWHYHCYTLCPLYVSSGADTLWRYHLTSTESPIMEIRWSFDHLICTMGFPILVRQHLYTESGPSWSLFCCGHIVIHSGTLKLI